MKQIFWSDKAEIGKEYKETTWYRVTPHFRDFIQKIRQKFNNAIIEFLGNLAIID